MALSGELNRGNPSDENRSKSTTLSQKKKLSSDYSGVFSGEQDIAAGNVESPVNSQLIKIENKRKRVKSKKEFYEEIKG